MTSDPHAGHPGLPGHLGTAPAAPVAPVADLATASRDNHLTLRRVARQQRIVELLGAARRPVSGAQLARDLGVGRRTVERDLARLRESGVPIESVPGAHGGSRLPAQADPQPVVLTFEEIAALIASLAALGPTETRSAASAMRALVRSIAPVPPVLPVPAVSPGDPAASDAGPGERPCPRGAPRRSR